MATVLITGGTGLIGKALTRELVDQQHQVIILTRNKKEHPQLGPVRYAVWNVQEQSIERGAIEKADYIIHLAGTNVAGKRWTEKQKQEIVDSRTQSAALLVKALQDIPNRVRAVISASAIGWYGPDPSIPSARPFVETDPADNDFLGTTCRKWEAAIHPVTRLNKRLVILRTGVVLSNEGGAYPEFKKTLKWGLAAVLGAGKQVISWIHMEDLVRLYCYAMENEKLDGVYNAVAPQPVSNKTLVLELARQRHRPYLAVNVPSFVLKLVLGEMSIEVLKSTTVSSRKVEESGFRFLHPDIASAVHQLWLQEKGRIKGDRQRPGPQG
ncbi:MAG: TIGR01777 family oxidoreductase [Flavisolibacter sp.]